MGNKKNRNPEKKERKRIEKEQKVSSSVQASVEEELRKKYFDEGFLHLDKGFTLVKLDKMKKR